MSEVSVTLVIVWARVFFFLVPANVVFSPARLPTV